MRPLNKDYEKLWDEQVRSGGAPQAAVGRISSENLKSQSDLFLRLMEDIETKDVLDAGCGYGRLAKVLTGHTKQTVGIDLSGEMLREAKNAVDSPLVKGSLTALPFARGTFSVVISDRVLMHLTREDLRNTLQEFQRVLKPRSALLFSVPFLFSLSGLKWEMKRQLARVLYSNKPGKAAFWRVIAARNFTKNAVKTILEEAGFRVDKILMIRDNYSTHLFVKAFRD